MFFLQSVALLCFLLFALLPLPSSVRATASRHSNSEVSERSFNPDPLMDLTNGRKMPEVQMQDLLDGPGGEDGSIAPSIPSEEPTIAVLKPPPPPSDADPHPVHHHTSPVPSTSSVQSSPSAPFAPLAPAAGDKGKDGQRPTLVPTASPSRPSRQYLVADPKISSSTPQPKDLYFSGVSVEVLYLLLALAIGICALVYYLRTFRLAGHSQSHSYSPVNQN
jgi:hypothetical protein